jgi:hypothetical protein
MQHRSFTKGLALSAFAIATFAAAASAQEVPNLVGTWSGTIAGGARFGALNHDPAEQDPVFANRTKVWTLTIERQDGSGLIGTWSTATKSEKIVGAIRRDNTSVLLADEDNTFDARLVMPNEMEVCALQAGAASIAVCYTMIRK